MRLSRTRLVSARLAWLIDVSFAGRMLRLSTEQLEVSSDDGTLLYEGCVESVKMVATRAALGAEPDADTCDIELTFPVDLVEAQGRGHRLDGALVEISQLIVGDAWEDRTRRLRGRVEGVQHGASTEPVRFRASGRAVEDRAVLPRPAARVTSATFSGAPESYLGRPYPIVFGTPGVYGLDLTTGGSPGLVVTLSGASARRLLIAGHDVVADTVTVTSSGLEGDEQVLDVEHDRDDVGQRYAYVDLDTGSWGSSADEDAFRAPTSTFAIRWTGGGALWNDRRRAALSSAGEILVWLLRQSTVEWDQGRTSVAAEHLRGYRVSGYIDEPTTIWEWLQAQLVTVVPIGWAQGAAGVYPVVRRRGLLRRDAIAVVDLDADPSVARVGDTGEELEDPANQITVRYALDVAGGDYKASVVLTGQGANLAAGEIPTLGGEISQLEVGDGTRRVIDRTIDLDIVYDRPTAVRVGLDALAQGTLPLRPLGLVAPSPAWEWVELGDVWAVSAEDLGLEESLFEVDRLERADDGVIGIQLVRRRDPARDVWRAA